MRSNPAKQQNKTSGEPKLGQEKRACQTATARIIVRLRKLRALLPIGPRAHAPTRSRDRRLAGAHHIWTNANKPDPETDYHGSEHHDDSYHGFTPNENGMDWQAVT